MRRTLVALLGVGWSLGAHFSPAYCQLAGDVSVAASGAGSLIVGVVATHSVGSPPPPPALTLQAAALLDPRPLLPSGAEGQEPLDLRIARHVRSPEYQRNPLLRGTARVARSAALPGTFAFAVLAYLAGQVDERNDLSDLGLRTGQAVATAGAVSIVGKFIVGRARPFMDDPLDVEFGRGLESNDYQSFPSTHTAAAFAAAAVAASELNDDGSGSEWITPLLYGGATLAGLSRIYHDDHWATDVLAGALIGVAGGFVTIELHRR